VFILKRVHFLTRVTRGNFSHSPGLIKQIYENVSSENRHVMTDIIILTDINISLLHSVLQVKEEYDEMKFMSP
jgi:hypothetical protein